MLLIIDNSVEFRKELRLDFFRRFAINTCTASSRHYESAFAKYTIGAAYIPNLENVPNPIGFCRRFKKTHPDIPLIASVPRDYTKIDLDVLFSVTDNIPLKPIHRIRVVEIIYELQRLYTGRDHLELTCGSLSLTPYTYTVFFCGTPIRMTVGMISILRYICEAAPRPVPVEELLATTGSPIVKRSLSAVRSQITEINRLSRRIVGAPIVSLHYGKGYIIATKRPSK